MYAFYYGTLLPQTTNKACQYTSKHAASKLVSARSRDGGVVARVASVVLSVALSMVRGNGGIYPT